MKKYLVITIDVEPDCTPTWTYSSPLTFAGVTTGIRDILQPLFNRYSVVPTYLINNVVLEDDASVDTLKQLAGKFELGTHLHPEFIEPDKMHSDYSGKKGVANCCFYPPDIEAAKIDNITKMFTNRFGYPPQSFRAGRFSAGDNTIRTLAKLGYKVDTSVTPNVRWDDRTRERAVDFRSSPVQPYRVSTSIKQGAEKGSLLEVPVTITRRKLSPLQYIRYIRTNKRIPFKGSRPLWLRPKFSSTADFETILRNVALDYAHHENIVYNMMFHNVEVMPGLSPYTTTQEDCALYLHSLEWLFRYCNENDIQTVALSSLYDIFAG